ncbi:uncharacterized protein IL334_003080 [Kwoniella shivajii]|uniref:NADP-dependent oxidoreductase domain-containing protein n=1 Tax=Kwoniella shivajii TaxID=564305 RepID=A0ABZ1CWJ3_9TREE|nr:hypothetical protein IL334_003080 [Kwoniella shivajii]
MSATTMTIAGRPTIRMGLGLMSLTLHQTVEESTAFEVIKTALDSGANLINTAMFYGSPEDKLSNLRLLGNFFKKYPEYIENAIVSVKGGMVGTFAGCTGDIDVLRKELQTARELLGGKEIDIFATARLPDDRPWEETVHNLMTLQKEGLFRTIGLSETGVESMKLAHNLAGDLVSSNEIEVSLQTLSDPAISETIKIAKELGIVIIGYSPFGHGLLNGQFDIKEMEKNGHDWRNFLPRFQGDNLNKNLKLVTELKELSKHYDRTLVELVLASLNKYSSNILPLPGSINPIKVAQNSAAAKVVITDEELYAILKIVQENPVEGTRYPEVGMGSLMK